MKNTLFAVLSFGLMLGALAVPSVSASFMPFGDFSYANQIIGTDANGGLATLQQAIALDDDGSFASAFRAIALDELGNFATRQTAINLGPFNPFW